MHLVCTDISLCFFFLSIFALRILQLYSMRTLIWNSWIHYMDWWTTRQMKHVFKMDIKYNLVITQYSNLSTCISWFSRPCYIFKIARSMFLCFSKTANEYPFHRDHIKFNLFLIMLPKIQDLESNMLLRVWFFSFGGIRV